MTSILDLPKVLLHDHLDGGLRAGTVLSLAGEHGYGGLPHQDEQALASWFDQTDSGSLVGYLAAFDETIAVMQTPSALERVAREAVEDLAADGVVYAEIRFAPSLHCRAGLSRAEVIDAVLAGLAAGEEATGVAARLIVDAMRQDSDSEEVARVAAEYVDRGVVGFDLAGPEAGFPAAAHAAALGVAGSSGLHVTVHAGEAAGPASMTDALDSGAERIGHGVRIVDDVVVRDGEIVECGPTARRVVDGGIPLEICPYSNLHTRAVLSPAAHPAGMLHRAGFTVTLNTDNRLMSNTTMTKEFSLATGLLGFSEDDLRAVTLNAVESAFCDEETRTAVRHRVLAGYGAS